MTGYREEQAAAFDITRDYFECERCGDTADVVPRTLATGEQADGAWLCRDRAACEGRAG